MSKTQAKPHFTFHLIPNAHLDPVWLWDWREGLNEGLTTCRTILDLMDENKDLTFIRGETFIYEHIERTDPATFARIKKYVKQKRWDPVGGTVIQPDTNLPDAETFARHFLHGQRYLQSRFGKPSRVAWAADSFGHAAGLPEILTNAGIEYFAFTRPAPNIIPIAKPAFWWAAPSGSRVLAYRPPVGWYGCEREEMTKRLDAMLEEAPKYDLHNLAVFFGLGNHGGGPTRKQIADLRAWAQQHPEVNLTFSGLHRYFDTLKSEISTRPRNFLPTHTGELNFVLRGCYSSVAKFKFAYRKTESQLQRAERTATLCRATGFQPVQSAHKFQESLYQSWHTLLFNSFHDILPGSSIERAYEDQLAHLGSAYHTAQKLEFESLNHLAQQIDTTVPQPKGDNPTAVPLLIFNPHPFPYAGPLELESSLDYRPIWKYSQKDNPPANLPIRVTGPSGKPIPFQTIETEHHAMTELAWRKRVIIQATLPAFGWTIIQMAYDHSRNHTPKITGTGTVKSQQQNDKLIGTGTINFCPSDAKITNQTFSIDTAPGSQGIQIHHKNKPLFPTPGIHIITVEDPWGSWGGMAEEPDSTHLDKIRHTWTVTQTKVLEPGPLRAALWVRLEAGHSRLDLTFHLSPTDPAIRVSARLFLNERSARVKMVIPFGETAEYQVPAATVTRGPTGEVPGGRWVRITKTPLSRDPQGSASSSPSELGFASDALYNFDTKDNTFRATLARASRYADDVNTPPDHEPWRPAVDAGELKFNFLLTLETNHLPILAQQLEQPPIALLVPPHPGKLKKSGSLASLTPSAVQILAFKQSEDRKSLILRLQETAGRATTPRLKLFGKSIPLTKLRPHQIATYRLTPTRAGYRAKPCTIPEFD